MKKSSFHSNNKMREEYMVLELASQAHWRKWLATNHDQCEGVWLALARKGSGLNSVNYAEALEVALCFGWIDGQVRRRDEATYLQKFTPRRARSIWSRRNCEFAEQFAAEGKMHAAGLAAMEAAKADGRWERMTRWGSRRCRRI